MISAALDYRPHLALLVDVDLPDMSGIEVVTVLRQHPELSGMRVAALTGWAGPEQRERTRTAGFDYYLTTPADPQTLERLLAKLAAER